MKLNGLEDYFKTENGEIVDFKQINSSGNSPLLYAFIFNKSHNLLLDYQQFSFLIYNSDISHFNYQKMTPLYAFINFHYNELTFIKIEDFYHILNNSELAKINIETISQIPNIKSSLNNFFLENKIFNHYNDNHHLGKETVIHKI